MRKEGACHTSGACVWRAGERRVHPPLPSLGRRAPLWMPHPARFLGPLFLAKPPSVFLGEQRGCLKEMLSGLGPSEPLGDTSSIPLFPASRAPFRLGFWNKTSKPAVPCFGSILQRQRDPSTRWLILSTVVTEQPHTVLGAGIQQWAEPGHCPMDS